ncbi:glycine/betaine ABC transporter substrate-binding protein [Rhodococcus sp. ACPA4]|jgi:osmoprotectant transport system substrate-binding protein|uniref:Osmoprotectant transport system substrate-binding protein n=1 Tax=Nocardia globerula TaxID=1818 RepID=A0A652YHA5_NOCGL|nr:MULTISPECIES: ABC transporter substrate-binding protein [Rhodococcus]NMD64350.1 ABC transporter substrate-binding protein [Nocardia globerula]KJF21629.1 Osmoprotectant-binding protein [Rhodococcus sp. AD45]PBC38031.1 glycine/betaine ABC transporter substrate-binding protein [Rhodococcus sp. ACPA4]PSR39086.1 glycine/betaine ABC transporter substrate-binding protein [Rhodococcus sp. AD45-ID]PVX66840.1 osmoprotectant transport system substrate-binding protein [Rhodococcus globerulus]
MRTSRFRSSRLLVAAATVLSLAALTACGSSDNSDSSSDPNTVVVGSANFTESEIIANIYAEALRVNGFDVSTSFNIGSREAYIPALKDGSITLIPDYTGNLLQYLDPAATATSSADVLAALPAALGSELAITTPASAEDKDAVVVTKETADKWNLKTIADLAPHSAEVKFGAPAEFQERPVGLPGLKANYGLDISASNFVPIADGGGPATVKALASGDITAANIFTTSASIPANNFVVLEDPKNNFPAQNVVPVLRASASSDKLAAVLDAVSAKLTTEELLDLNVAVSGDAKTEPAAAAKAWISAQGLDKPVS